MDLTDSKYYYNRELSWLEFNERVLEEAMDETNPLFERLNFTAITSSNLDEFFMIRVSSLIDQIEAGYTGKDPAGFTPKRQLDAISKRVHKMVNHQYMCFYRSILPALEKEHILFPEYEDLDEREKEYVMRYFYTTVFPILTPMAIDKSRPFPLLNNKALVFLVELTQKSSKRQLAALQVPTVISRILLLPQRGDNVTKIMLLERIIQQFIAELFLGCKVLKSALFRITRNSDLEIDEEDAPDLLDEIEKSIKLRKWGKPVRLEIDKSMSKYSSTFLKKYLEVEDRDIYETKGFLDLTFCFQVKGIPGFEQLRDTVLKPLPVKEFLDTDVFTAIKRQDILVHHPYDSFDCVIDFVRTAAQDPDVLAIKQTLYRVSGNSPIIAALMEAAENGKQVTAMVELKARFDEENNINWARQLEHSGCHVVYGLVGLKTHCKACLVVRREEEGIMRYVHMGTGNYNDSTAKIYTDMGFFTCRESFGRDISALFNSLTGYSSMESWHKIIVAPKSMRHFFVDAIRAETENAKNGKEARIIGKMNSLVDVTIIQALYEASAAGVQIDLIVRGICCLRAGVAGISENITVSSIVDRFLEHSRIYYFHNDGTPKVYLSSADWMPRNLDRRVEIAFPIEDLLLVQELTDILATTLADNVKRRVQLSDGTYKKPDNSGKDPLHSQIQFYSDKKRSIIEVTKNKSTEHQFIPIYKNNTNTR